MAFHPFKTHSESGERGGNKYDDEDGGGGGGGGGGDSDSDDFGTCIRGRLGKLPMASSKLPLSSHYSFPYIFHYHHSKFLYRFKESKRMKRAPCLLKLTSTLPSSQSACFHAAQPTLTTSTDILKIRIFLAESYEKRSILSPSVPP
ncbi:hypothetical protein GX48_05247 [Paracoccidioides brasiliensis]|nr:hypothetical protein GX48_05247 [Paracoccidioides brasiliensis]